MAAKRAFDSGKSMLCVGGVLDRRRDTDISATCKVLWRGSKYVGCADAQKTRSDGWTCHTQVWVLTALVPYFSSCASSVHLNKKVCRYARPGNCNVGRYITGDKMWWLDPVMQDTSPCGPACPPDGCT